MEKKNIIKSLSFNIDDFVDTLDFYGETITYKYYLPIDTKLQLATDVVNIVINDSRYPNPGKIRVYEVLYFIKYYTNVDIEEFMNTDALNTYDKVITSNLYHMLMQDTKLREDWLEVKDIIAETITEIYKYNNSALGIIEAAAADYDNTAFDIDNLAKQMSNPENIGLLKDVITKLG